MSARVSPRITPLLLPPCRQDQTAMGKISPISSPLFQDPTNSGLTHNHSEESPQGYPQDTHPLCLSPTATLWQRQFKFSAPHIFSSVNWKQPHRFPHICTKGQPPEIQCQLEATPLVPPSPIPTTPTPTPRANPLQKLAAAHTPQGVVNEIAEPLTNIAPIPFLHFPIHIPTFLFLH